MGWIAGLLALLAIPAHYQCLTYDGRTVCGYRCDATNGHVGCAQTPDGICVTASGRLTCFDPPDWVRAHYGAFLPLPSCLSRNGETACGYHCRSHDGEVRCAESPDGVCGNSPHELVCWDPSPALYCTELGRPLPRPRCLVHQGEIACGYNCEARSGALGCAASPSGRCIIEKGEVSCFDPPPPLTCEAGAWCGQSIDLRPWCQGMIPTR